LIGKIAFSGHSTKKSFSFGPTLLKKGNLILKLHRKWTNNSPESGPQNCKIANLLIEG